MDKRDNTYSALLKKESDKMSSKSKRKKKKQEELEPKAVKKMKKQQQKEQKEIEKEEKNKRRKKKIRRFLLIAIILSIVVLGIYLGISAHTWKTLAKDMLLNECSIVLDSGGNTIATLGDEKKKKPITAEEMPKNLKNAYVAIEDERFYKHKGVDLKRTASATVSYIIHFGSSSFGGSTITQQLVKNLTGDTTDSITRKVKEWWKAWQLETCLSKEEVLEGYLNIIYVGPGIYGVEAGSQYYFSKSAKDLTLEECAFLAGLNHSPNSYNPFVGKDNDALIKKRTKIVLGKMKELGYLTSEEEYEKAVENVESGLKFKQGKIESGDGIYSYHTDALLSELTNEMASKYHISETFATNYITMSGSTIQSTQNTKVQKEMETESAKSKYVLASKKGADPAQSAMVVIDHKTGDVVGCIGGLGKKTTARAFNRATQSVRQTGSSIKPIAVVAPAINEKIVTAATIVDDTEKDFENGYHPTDYNNCLGEITVRRAVESSQNIPFVEIMEKLKPINSINYLKKMGITSLTDKDESLPLALGGLDKGISPLQMAGAYATIANDGVYIEPTFYKEMKNKSGTTVIKSKQKSKRVFSTEVAYIVKEILTEPTTGKNGTARYCQISGVDVATKTGTTDDNFDRWLCGFTPYYTAITWFGYDQNESIDFNQRNPAGLIWANVMSRIHVGLESAHFQKTNKIYSATICKETGKQATTNCKDTYTEYFLKGTVPSLCTLHPGSELKDTDLPKEDTNTVKKEIIKGITNEIDEKEPPVTNNQQTENKVNQNNNITTNTSVNTNKNTNTTTNSNSTQNATKNQNTTNNNKVTNSSSSSNITNSTVTNTTNTVNTTNSN